MKGINNTRTTKPGNFEHKQYKASKAQNSYDYSSMSCQAFSRVARLLWSASMPDKWLVTRSWSPVSIVCWLLRVDDTSYTFIAYPTYWIRWILTFCLSTDNLEYVINRLVPWFGAHQLEFKTAYFWQNLSECQIEISTDNVFFRSDLRDEFQRKNALLKGQMQNIYIYNLESLKYIIYII